MATAMEQKLNALTDEIDRAWDTGSVNVDEILRLATDLRRESSTPVFVQQMKRKRGIDTAPKDASFRPATF